MANQIEVLKQTELLGQQFEVYGTPQEPLFVATDVAKMIEHTQPSKLVQMVEEDEKLMGTIFLSGQNREVWMLTENGLYEVLMQSRKPIAKQFKKGVKAILKEIRTNGGYVATTQEDTPEMIMARALQVAQSTIERHQQQLQAARATITSQSEQLQAQAPKVAFAEKNIVENLRSSEKVSIFVAVTDGSCTYFAEQAVKLLTSKVGFFIAHLKDIGGCLLRKIIKALGVEIPSVTSAKWQPLFPMPTTV